MSETIDSGAPAAPAEAAPVLSPSQQKSAEIKAEIMAKGAREKLTEGDWARLKSHSAWADRIEGAREPLENRLANPQAADHRPANPERMDLEAHSSDIAPEERARLISSATLNGAPRKAAEAVMAVAQSAGVDAADASTLMRRVAHFAQQGEIGPDGPARLAPEDQADIAAEADRLLGGKLEEISGQVREFLQQRGVLAALDRAGFTASALALDPKVLIALKHAADVAAARGRK